MSYTYFLNDSQVTLINLETGNKITIYEDDTRFARALELVSIQDWVSLEALDVKTVVANYTLSSTFGGLRIEINDGVGVVKLYGAEYPLADAITKRIIKMSELKISPQPLVNFLSNLYNNPSKTAIDELFLFLEASELPITENGEFIAYKLVKNDYTDIYTGKMDNSIGKTVSMPRFAVDDKRSNTCSAGLHFCSRSYLAHYGSSNRGDDRVVIVSIDPANVVSIPSDYNNAKGRTCSYTVVGEVEGGRASLETEDYTDSPVVSANGGDYDGGDYDDGDYDDGDYDDGDDYSDINDVFNTYFYVDGDGEIRYADSDRVALTSIVYKWIKRDTFATDDEISSFLETL